MPKLEDEIENITKQTEWPMSDAVVKKVEPIRKEKQKLKKEIENLEAKLKLLNASAHVKHLELWQTIHDLMPEVPEEESLTFNLDKKVVHIASSMGERLKEFLGDLPGRIIGGEIIGGED